MLRNFTSDKRNDSYSDFGNLESSGEFRKLKNELKWRQCVIYIGLFLTNSIALLTLISLKKSNSLNKFNIKIKLNIMRET